MLGSSFSGSGGLFRRVCVLGSVRLLLLLLLLLTPSLLLETSNFENMSANQLLVTFAPPLQHQKSEIQGEQNKTEEHFVTSNGVAKDEALQNQRVTFVDNILAKFYMAKSSPIFTPLIISQHSLSHDSPYTTKGYLSIHLRLALLFACYVISWRTKKQAMLAFSSTKAKYLVASLTTQEGIWMKSITNELAILKIFDF